jgi:hypothetical protein
MRHPPQDHLDLLNGELKRRTEIQLEELEGIDRKASTVLAGTGVLLGLVVNNFKEFPKEDACPATLFFGALLVLVLGLSAGVAALWPRRAKVVPAPRQLVEAYYAKTKQETAAVLISTRLKAFEENKNLSRAKGLFLRAQMLFLMIGGAALAGAYALKELHR